MFELKPLPPKTDRPLLEESHTSAEPKQRRMMAIALALLVVALGFVLYRDRDFWFPDTQDAQEEYASTQQVVASNSAPAQPMVKKELASKNEAKRHGAVPAATQPADTSTSDPPPLAVQRTALPALEVEVVAGDVHRTLRPGSNSVHVDLQPTSPAQQIVEAPVQNAEPRPAVTNASEHVQMSADASEVVTHSVKPGYPMLARQMKVQGSVILQALISRDGAIQDLHVMAGPPILAGAAREAVRQWRFKPHYQGAESVETQAKITVNFTISTN